MHPYRVPGTAIDRTAGIAHAYPHRGSAAPSNWHTFFQLDVIELSEDSDIKQQEELLLGSLTLL